MLMCMYLKGKTLLILFARKQVFDYDWGLQDDFMGSATLDLTQLELGRLQDIIIKLEDPARPQRDLGELRINATLWPRTQEDKEQVQFLI